MRYISERDARSFAVSALGSRLFFAVSIDLPNLLNAGWISGLAACILTLPLTFCLHFLERKWKKCPADMFSRIPLRLYALVLCVFSLYDIGCILRLFTLSAQHTALENISAWVLMPVLALAAALCCVSGTQAVSSAVRVSVRLLAVMLLMIVLVQLKDFNMRWLTPALGPGIGTLTRPLGSLAGLMTAVIPLWAIRTYPKEQPAAAFSVPALIGYIAFGASGLLVLFSMLSPLLTGVPDTRLFSFDRLLTNGRISISLQFVLQLAWHTSMMHMLVFSLICAASMLLIAFPALKYLWSVFACVLLALLVPAFSLDNAHIVQGANLIRWCAATFPIFILAFAEVIQSRKEKKA